MGTRIRRLTVLAVIGIATTVTACGNAASSQTQASAPASSPAATPAAAVVAIPAGDHRIGGATQGISIEVPASFTAIDLRSLASAQASLRQLGLTGAKAATITRAIPAMEKDRGVIAVDRASATSGFASNLNAYCVDSGTDLTGTDMVPAFRQVTSQLQQQLGATNVTSTAKEIGGVPGVETTYHLQSSGFGTIYGSQLEVAAKPHKACYVTLSEGRPVDDVLSVAAATAEFY
jgi:hypothetical protein